MSTPMSWTVFVKLFLLLLVVVISLHSSWAYPLLPKSQDESQGSTSSNEYPRISTDLQDFEYFKERFQDLTDKNNSVHETWNASPLPSPNPLLSPQVPVTSLPNFPTVNFSLIIKEVLEIKPPTVERNLSESLGNFNQSLENLTTITTTDLPDMAERANQILRKKTAAKFVTFVFAVIVFYCTQCECCKTCKKCIKCNRDQQPAQENPTNSNSTEATNSYVPTAQPEPEPDSKSLDVPMWSVDPDGVIRRFEPTTV